MVFLALYVPHENPDSPMGQKQLKCHEKMMKRSQIFMVNEYFHIHRAFMAVKIMNPLNSKP